MLLIAAIKARRNASSALKLIITCGSCSSAVDFRAGSADFVDLNGDALPDVLDTAGGEHRLVVQTASATATAYGSATTSERAGSGAMDLVSADVQLVEQAPGQDRSQLVPA